MINVRRIDKGVRQIIYDFRSVTFSFATTLRVSGMWGKPEGMSVNLRVYRLFVGMYIHYYSRRRDW